MRKTFHDLTETQQMELADAIHSVFCGLCARYNLEPLGFTDQWVLSVLPGIFAKARPGAEEYALRAYLMQTIQTLSQVDSTEFQDQVMAPFLQSIRKEIPGKFLSEEDQDEVDQAMQMAARAHVKAMKIYIEQLERRTQDIDPMSLINKAKGVT